MSLRKVKIENFKIFDGTFELELNSGLNILVGDNEVGKSTILEAIHLALTGMINGRYLNTELTQYLFNNAVVKRYLDSLSTSDPLEAPRIKIELFFNDVEGNNSLKTFMGGINTEKDKDAFGILFVIEIDDSNIEYKEFLDIPENTLPIEFYDYKWYTFADALVTAKNIPIKSALIDSSLFRYQNGSDIYISRIVRQILEPNDILKMSQAHRTMRDYFMANDAVREINQKILSAAPITDKTISLSAEFLSKNAWENGLITYVNKVPFQYVGKGEQCVIKTKLALASKKAQNASVLLMEEPENHLTHARLNQLLENIESDTKNRQVIISTHSSFVANKLGFDNLILLNHNGKHAKFKDLNEETSSFFKKLPGYDTLRLVLCQKAILVEGPSDELIIQKAYLRIKSKLPIQDGIEVISVGTSFLRFLHVAEYLDIRVAVVTDNDGDIDKLKRKYYQYIDGKIANIYISYDNQNRSEIEMPKYNYNTLENLILITNDLKTLNEIFKTKLTSDNAMRYHMLNNKTDCALSILNWEGSINFPTYIIEAINFVSK